MNATRTLAISAALLLPLAAWGGAVRQNALHFSGDGDHVAMSALPAFANDLTQDFTITFWLRRDADVAGRVFFAQRDSANFATLLSNNGVLLFYVKRDNTTFSVSVPTTPLGEWKHVALRWTGLAALPEILIDGEPQTGAPGGASSFTLNGAMTLGSRTDGTQPLQGALDDFTIWNTVRSVEQLRAERVSTCVPRTGMVSRYDFDLGFPGGDNTGLTTLPDDAGTNPGTLQGFALQGDTSNWIASPIARVAPALVFDPPLDGLATGEDGSGYSGSVRLAVPPVAAVSVTLASDTPGEAAVAPAMLEFTPGNWDQPQPVTIAGVDDGVADGAGAFLFTASTSSGDPCQDALAVSQAGSNAPLVAGTVDIADALQAEGDAGAADLQFTATYTGTAAPPFSVAYATQDGSAVAGSDYLATAGTLAFSGTPGETRALSVPLFGNREAQGDRDFRVLLDAPSQAGIALGDGEARGDIVDDDLDVRVTLDDGVTVVQGGQTVAYDLVVANLSPTLDAGAVPLAFVAVPLHDLAWSCVPAGGASCEGGAGAFSAQPTLPSGAQVSYTITGVVAPTLGTAEGPAHLVATATASAAGDGQPGNDSATDVDQGPRIFTDGYE